MSVSWITVNGIKYSIKSTVVVDLNDDDENLPGFGRIKKIFRNKDGHVLFLCIIITTSGFDFDYHAYDVKFTNKLVCVPFDSLVDPFPVILVKTKYSMYAKTKHKL